MSSDIMAGIRGLLSGAWRFLMATYIPDTNITYGVFFIGLAMLSLGFKFLSIVVGHSIGAVDDLPAGIGMIPKNMRTLKARISPARKNDVR